MKKEVILAVMLSLMVAVPIGLVTAIAVPDEVTITEERCIITSNEAKNIVLGYYYMHENYHYESRFYGYDDDGYPLYQDVKIHDSWEERERTVTTFVNKKTLNYWLTVSRAFLRCDGEESNEFDIRRQNFYVRTISGVEVTINNEATENVTYSISPLLVGLIFVIVTTPIIFVVIRPKFLKYYRSRESEAQRRIMERETSGYGYREY